MIRYWKTTVLVCLILLGYAIVASAQTTVPVNPTGIEWTVDVDDHNMTARYEMDVRPVGGGAVERTYVFMAASYVPDGAGRITSAAWNSQPIPFGNWEATMRACWDTPSGQDCSADSDPSNEFRRRAGRPGTVIVIP